MKRIQEKVKDMVEVRKFLSLKDFTSDPAVTLASYYFTEATSYLMTNWLDRISSANGENSPASALAGYRGVGKSHFLATFGAILAFPDLRAKINDPHVSAGAQSLLRRRYPVANVRRGLKPTLCEELADAISIAFDIDVSTLSGSIAEILTIARTRTGDTPLVILIDTALERGARVSRDDGRVLAEIAEAAKSLNCYVAVALDDDISGADGSNSAIVGSFSIDYLEQEHLYKVVDTFVFPKHNQLRPVLHDVYEYFRTVIPTFRWSEQKFSALYPLHPAILEVAPFVRLYVHDFALLGFAAEAGERILGRPANSLIALDEVFDSAEKELRRIEDLKEAFEAYDRLNADVVAKIPVMQRLQAKLILKALLLLSLEGQGTTAADICSGMLIFDESDPKRALRTVEELIRMFATALPDAVVVHSEEGREVRYGLKVSSKDKLNHALDQAAASVDQSVLFDILQRQFNERFDDCTFLSVDGGRKNVMECQMSWRGGIHRGRVTWKGAQPESVSASEAATGPAYDWEVVVDLSDSELPAVGAVNENPKVTWRPAELSRDEKDTILRFHVLGTDMAIREEYGDSLRASLHSHAVILDRIVNRIFLEDGRLIIDGFDYNFTDDARVAPSLGELFSIMLEPLFEVRYPQHPFFFRRLGVSEVASLISDLYSGSRQKLAEVQQLAQTFALPLGLVKLADSVYQPSNAESLRSNEWVSTILRLVDEGGEKGVDLVTVYSELKKPPYGFAHEAQQLIMAAMVSQRMIEFVTSKGDRINQRSLDLRIIWDDIVGLARPAEASYSSQLLIKWAVTFASGGEFKSFESRSDCENLKIGLFEWLENWETSNVLEQFDNIPPEFLNARIWRIAAKLNSSLGVTASLIRKFREEPGPIEDCIGRISDAFFNDVANIEKAVADLSVIEQFVKNFEQRRSIRSYISLAECTDVPVLEDCRETLLRYLDEFEEEPNDNKSREIGYLWARFEREFGAYFSARHDAVMRSTYLSDQRAEAFASDDWWNFETLSPFVDTSKDAFKRFEGLRKLIGELKCDSDTKALLKERPFCNCRYSLSDHLSLECLSDEFRETLRNTVLEIKEEIVSGSSDLIPIIEQVGKSGGRETAVAAGELISSIRSNDLPEKLSDVQRTVLIISLRRAQSTRATTETVRPPKRKAKQDDPSEVGSVPSFSLPDNAVPAN